MKVAVLGTGVVGQAHAAKLSDLGHDVMIGTHDVDKALARTEPGRMSEAFGSWAKKHPKVKVATFAEAADEAELVIEAISGQAVVETLKGLAKQLNGKVLVDISNPLDFSQGMPPRLFTPSDDSLGERIQAVVPQTKVVKTFNTTNTSIQVDPKSLTGGDHHLFVAGNDQAAKGKVVKLAEEYGWQHIIDLGDIKAARGMEMVLPLWTEIYAARGNAQFNFKIVD